MKTNDVIIQFTAKIVFFIIFFFSIHIFLAGHYTPGGGFVGGLLTSSAIVLLVLAFDLNTVRHVLPINYTYLTAIGLLLALATAAFPMFLGKPFFHTFFLIISIYRFLANSHFTRLCFLIAVSIWLLSALR